MKLSTWSLAFVVAACASTSPAPKLAWPASEAADQSEPDEDAVSPPDVDAEAEMRAASPLAQSTARFDGVEQVLRSRFPRAAMPTDAERAWGGMLAVVDEALRVPGSTTREDFLRARATVHAAWVLDSRSYAVVPVTLAGEVQGRLIALTAHLTLEKRAAAEPALVWPLSPDQVTSLFGSRPDPFDHSVWRLHQGVDLSAPAGTLVITAGAGVVVESGWRRGFGLMASVRHPDGTITRYGHLSHLLTREGLELHAGDAIGLVGATGRATGPHLHFEIWRHGQAVDPLIELGDPEVDLPGVASAP